MYSISIIYPALYTEKFGTNNFVNIYSGTVKSDKKVYMYLEDINLLEGLNDILNFYQKIEKEGDIFNIYLTEKYTECCSNLCFRLCLECNMYLCNNYDHLRSHDYHMVQNDIKKNKKFSVCYLCKKYTQEPLILNKKNYCCYECNKNIEIFNGSKIINYNKPVIENFNLYEWIPIKNYIENRNINSHLYKRKIIVKTSTELSTGTKLLNLKLLNINSNNIKTDYILRMFEDLNINNYIVKKIINYYNFLN